MSTQSNTKSTSSSFRERNHRSKADSPLHSSGEMQPRQDFLAYARAYTREKPEVVALWCFGIGFVLGWKLKPW